MTAHDIADAHKGVKKGSYWENLTGGDTAAYKLATLRQLVEAHRPARVESLLDIGCGTCEVVFDFQLQYGAKAACMDYDPMVIDRLKAMYPHAAVDWLVADAFALASRAERYDLVFMLDMVHEVYSFYGRPDRKAEEPVDHVLGLQAVERLLDSVAGCVRPGGLIAITDNVLTEETGPVRVRLKTPEAAEAVRHFLEHYPTRRMPIAWEGADVLTLRAHDFCILLTQYNKIKKHDWDRWNVEKMEIHQYWTLGEYGTAFDARGFDLHAEVGTPQDAAAEWGADFEVLSGLPGVPHKRITLVAKKRARKGAAE